jgi:hypothetical protein
MWGAPSMATHQGERIEIRSSFHRTFAWVQRARSQKTDKDLGHRWAKRAAAKPTSVPISPISPISIFLPGFLGPFQGFIFHCQDITGHDDNNDCIKQNVTLPMTKVRNRIFQSEYFQYICLCRLCSMTSQID